MAHFASFMALFTDYSFGKKKKPRTWQPGASAELHYQTMQFRYIALTALTAGSIFL
jgi:hypothetical protein